MRYSQNNLKELALVMVRVAFIGSIDSSLIPPHCSSSGDGWHLGWLLWVTGWGAGAVDVGSESRKCAGSCQDHSACHEIRFLGLISCFHDLTFSCWTYYSDPFSYGLPFSSSFNY